ncbi:conserved Plasmodium protein, unknown function [Plasmodium ovale wallikeri]|uniref:Uncharacterized protein n=1 Tax=Plasmodium ovale wallikeri TaxID=864142 RepID=A0A1A8YYV1_PLAOA|nr:conserved Plasmodium protein, unknown function [Plasmodium ovale wallikeri]
MKKEPNEKKIKGNIYSFISTNFKEEKRKIKKKKKNDPNFNNVMQGRCYEVKKNKINFLSVKGGENESQLTSPVTPKKYVDSGSGVNCSTAYAFGENVLSESACRSRNNPANIRVEQGEKNKNDNYPVTMNEGSNNCFEANAEKVISDSSSNIINSSSNIINSSSNIINSSSNISNSSSVLGGNNKANWGNFNSRVQNAGKDKDNPLDVKVTFVRKGAFSLVRESHKGDKNAQGNQENANNGKNNVSSKVHCENGREGKHYGACTSVKKQHKYTSVYLGNSPSKLNLAYTHKMYKNKKNTYNNKYYRNNKTQDKIMVNKNLSSKNENNFCHPVHNYGKDSNSANVSVNLPLESDTSMVNNSHTDGQLQYGDNVKKEVPKNEVYASETHQGALYGRGLYRGGKNTNCPFDQHGDDQHGDDQHGNSPVKEKNKIENGKKQSRKNLKMGMSYGKEEEKGPYTQKEKKKHDFIENDFEKTIEIICDKLRYIFLCTDKECIHLAKEMIEYLWMIKEIIHSVEEPYFHQNIFGIILNVYSYLCVKLFSKNDILKMIILKCFVLLFEILIKLRKDLFNMSYVFFLYVNYLKTNINGMDVLKKRNVKYNAKVASNDEKIYIKLANSFLCIFAHGSESSSSSVRIEAIKSFGCALSVLYKGGETFGKGCGKEGGKEVGKDSDNGGGSDGCKGGRKEGKKGGSKEESKEESKEKSKEENKEGNKEGNKEESKEESKGGRKGRSKGDVQGVRNDNYGGRFTFSRNLIVDCILGRKGNYLKGVTNSKMVYLEKFNNHFFNRNYDEGNGFFTRKENTIFPNEQVNSSKSVDIQNKRKNIILLTNFETIFNSEPNAGWLCNRIDDEEENILFFIFKVFDFFMKIYDDKEIYELIQKSIVFFLNHADINIFSYVTYLITKISYLIPISKIFFNKHISVLLKNLNKERRKKLFLMLSYCRYDKNGLHVVLNVLSNLCIYNFNFKTNTHLIDKEYDTNNVLKNNMDEYNMHPYLNKNNLDTFNEKQDYNNPNEHQVYLVDHMVYNNEEWQYIYAVMIILSFKYGNLMYSFFFNKFRKNFIENSNNFCPYFNLFEWSYKFCYYISSEVLDFAYDKGLSLDKSCLSILRRENADYTDSSLLNRENKETGDIRKGEKISRKEYLSPELLLHQMYAFLEFPHCIKLDAPSRESSVCYVYVLCLLNLFFNKEMPFFCENCFFFKKNIWHLLHDQTNLRTNHFLEYLAIFKEYPFFYVKNSKEFTALIDCIGEAASSNREMKKNMEEQTTAGRAISKKVMLRLQRVYGSTYGIVREVQNGGKDNKEDVKADSKIELAEKDRKSIIHFKQSYMKYTEKITDIINEHLVSNTYFLAFLRNNFEHIGAHASTYEPLLRNTLTELVSYGALYNHGVFSYFFEMPIGEMVTRILPSSSNKKGEANKSVKMHPNSSGPKVTVSVSTGKEKSCDSVFPPSYASLFGKRNISNMWNRYKCKIMNEFCDNCKGVHVKFRKNSANTIGGCRKMVEGYHFPLVPRIQCKFSNVEIKIVVAEKSKNGLKCRKNVIDFSKKFPEYFYHKKIINLNHKIYKNLMKIYYFFSNNYFYSVDISEIFRHIVNRIYDEYTILFNMLKEAYACKAPGVPFFDKPPCKAKCGKHVKSGGHVKLANRMEEFHHLVVGMDKLLCTRGEENNDTYSVNVLIHKILKLILKHVKDRNFINYDKCVKFPFLFLSIFDVKINLTFEMEPYFEFLDECMEDDFKKIFFILPEHVKHFFSNLFLCIEYEDMFLINSAVKDGAQSRNTQNEQTNGKEAHSKGRVKGRGGRRGGGGLVTYNFVVESILSEDHSLKHLKSLGKTNKKDTKNSLFAKRKKPKTTHQNVMNESDFNLDKRYLKTCTVQKKKRKKIGMKKNKKINKSKYHKVEIGEWKITKCREEDHSIEGDFSVKALKNVINLEFKKNIEVNFDYSSTLPVKCKSFQLRLSSHTAQVSLFKILRSGVHCYDSVRIKLGQSLDEFRLIETN